MADALVLDEDEVTILQELLLLFKVKPRFMGQKQSDLVDRIYAAARTERPRP